MESENRKDGVNRVAGLDSVFYALNTEDGEIIWSNQFQRAFSSDLFANTDGVYVGSADEFLYQMDPSTGIKISKLAVGGKPVGTIASTDESLLLIVNQPQFNETSIS